VVSALKPRGQLCIHICGSLSISSSVHNTDSLLSAEMLVRICENSWGEADVSLPFSRHNFQTVLIVVVKGAVNKIIFQNLRPKLIGNY